MTQIHAVATSVRAFAALLLLAVLVGCASPLDGPDADERMASLRRSVVQTLTRQLAEASADPEPVRTQRESSQSELGLSEERIAELDDFAGPNAYGRPLSDLPLGKDLLGEDQRVVAVSLERAVQSAVENNLDLQFASLQPAIGGAQLAAAEAAFDWVFFNTLTFQETDREDPARGNFNPPLTQQTFWQNQTGLRKPLRSGGALTLQQTISDTRDDSPNVSQTPNSANQAEVALVLNQPLLRGFGTEASLSQIRLARNAERTQIANLKASMIETVRQTEEAYWRLYQAHRDLLVVQQLLERGIAVANQVEQRRLLDATPAQIADAKDRVESRKADRLRAQRTLRDASNRLKLLMNDPAITIGSEVLLVPADEAVDQAIEFSLADAIVTAVRHRPELETATLSIDDAWCRERFARNQELPQLDLQAQVSFLGLDSGVSGAYDDVGERSFTNYLASLAFEQPIGNREAAALTRQRRLERLQTVVNYRQVVDQVIFELKSALDDVFLNYQLIEQTRVSRLSASESLRALLVEKETIAGFTVERLDLELNRQERLAASEQAETRALADYNIAVSNYFASTGRLLERNRIEFVVPDADASFDERGRLRDGAP